MTRQAYTMTTQKVDMQLEGRNLESRYQPFASSLYIKSFVTENKLLNCIWMWSQNKTRY